MALSWDIPKVEVEETLDPHGDILYSVRFSTHCRSTLQRLEHYFKMQLVWKTPADYGNDD